MLCSFERFHATAQRFLFSRLFGIFHHIFELSHHVRFAIFSAVTVTHTTVHIAIIPAVSAHAVTLCIAATTAGNAVANGLGISKAKVNAALQAAGLDIRLRPEQLTLEDYCALQAALAAAE